MTGRCDTVISARPAPGRSIDADSFADLTSATATVSWADDGLLEVTFDAALDDTTARVVRCRIIAASPAEETLMQNLAAVLAEQPTTTATRLDRIERAVIALAKLELRDQT